MATLRGFVETIEVRGDGWCSIALDAVNAGNTLQTFFIPNLDGDLTQNNKRLGQLSLLRDALARVLPVEIDYTSSADQGNLIDDVIIHPRPSLDARPGTVTVDGVVIGLSVNELWPQSDSSPYLDAPDVANVIVLTDAGDVQGLLLDLQRPDPLTAQAEFRMLRMAYRSRRPVQLLVSAADPGQAGQPSAAAGAKETNTAAAKPSDTQTGGGYIQATRFVALPESDLSYVYAFLERLGQRYESYNSTAAPAISHVKVVYTTAPGQTPEGDVSDNGSFTPQRLTAWVPDDSPLLVRLDTALRNNLQVKLGLPVVQAQGDNAQTNPVEPGQIHEVELVSHMGSAARPIWIVEECKFTACDSGDASCTNVPTVQGPGAASFTSVAHSMSWHGKGYFQEGIWRFILGTGICGEIKIDGKTICCSKPDQPNLLEHAYLKGLHCVEIELCGVTCASAFTIQIYRIR
jgi:hypothetical protein